MQLKSAPKTYTDAQDKNATPEETVQRALGKLETMTDVDDIGLEQRADPITGAYTFNSKSTLVNCSGKGLTAPQARASAVMELAERYSWLRYDYEKADGYRVASHQEVEQGSTSTVSADYFVNNFFGLRDRAQIQEEAARIPLKWVNGFSLTRNEPFAYPINWHNMVCTSNGLAAGNTLEEAILQGLCEVLERECVYRLFVERRAGYSIDLDSIDNPLLRRVIDNGVAAGIRFRALDISSDLGAPTFIVQGTREQDAGKLYHTGCGHGCHTDPAKALMRAFSEYFEGYTALCEIPEESGITLEVAQSILPPLHYGFVTMLNPDMILESAGRRALSEIQSVSRDDIKDEIEAVVEHLSSLGHEVVVVDKTHPELQIPTVRVFVPTLRNCMNCDYEHPHFTMAEVYHEAGNSRASMTHLGEALSRSPFLRFANQHLSMLKSFFPLLSVMSSSMVFTGDFREALKKVGRLKKSGIGVLSLVGNLQSCVAHGIGVKPSS